MKKAFKENLGFIITMLIFAAACAAVTAFTVRDEPQYMRFVPADTRPTTTEETEESREPALLNLNTATLEELQTLPGIGEARARDIIAYRETHGGFRNAEELTAVEGIGAATLEQLRPYIYAA
jgi:comEA protein